MTCGASRETGTSPKFQQQVKHIFMFSRHLLLKLLRDSW
jgi:hypothetical protein